MAVAERVRASEGALDRSAAFPEHGVELGVPGDRVAQVLHGVDLLVAVA